MSRNIFDAALNNVFPVESRWFLYSLGVAVVFDLTWRFLVRPRRSVVPHPPLTVPEIACLRTWQAPLLAVMGRLRAGGHLDTEGRADPAFPLPPGTDDFTRRLAARLDGSAFSVNQLLLDQMRPLRDLEDELARRGYLHTRGERWRIRFGALPLTALCLAGSVSTPILIAGHGSPADITVVGYLMPSLFTAVFLLPALWSAGRASRAGRRYLADERARASYLAPAARPAFATYGAAAVGLSVALFGTAALWQIDPRYAAAMAVAGGAGSSGSDASCGGGSSCGGASCGGGGGGCGGCGGGCGG